MLMSEGFKPAEKPRHLTEEEIGKAQAGMAEAQEEERIKSLPPDELEKEFEETDAERKRFEAQFPNWQERENRLAGMIVSVASGLRSKHSEFTEEAAFRKDERVFRQFKNRSEADLLRNFIVFQNEDPLSQEEAEIIKEYFPQELIDEATAYLKESDEFFAEAKAIKQKSWALSSEIDRRERENKAGN
jgi:hypothetical protein